MVLMIQEEGAWRPKVAFGDDSAAPAPIGPWFNVTCTCGRKIGVDRRLAGRMTKCSICGQEILIALSTGPGGDDATKILHGARVSDTPLPQPRAPTEMHLLCVCGETLLITSDYFNSAIQCGSCGIRLSLHMRYDAARRRYELNANVLAD